MLTLAAVVGVEPWRFTWRQLQTMAEAKRREQWSHTAEILSLLYNPNRPEDSDPTTADDWNPYAIQTAAERREAATVPGNPITILKALLPAQNPAKVS